MAISKVIYNTDTLMDVTQDTVESNNMLSGIKATASNGQTVTGQIETKTSSDMTVSGATVTAPAGYYASATSKSVATTTHPKPTVSINTSTGVVTASHAQSTGYVTGGTTTETLSLSTQAAKVVTPTESQQVAVSAGKYTTGDVSVAAIDDEYVGSDVPRKTSSNLTASGNAVTVPAGYYASSASKDVASGSATIPATTITAQPEISLEIETGLVTATNTKTQSVTPTVSAGYVSSGTAGTITVSGGSTMQLATQGATTITPSTEEQTAVSSGKYTTGAIKVSAIPSNMLRTYKATITSTGGSSSSSSGKAYVRYPGDTGTEYYTKNNVFYFTPGETLYIIVSGRDGSSDAITIDGENVVYTSYHYTLPDHPINIELFAGSNSTADITEDVVNITTNGTHDTSDYATANVDVHEDLVEMSWAKIKQCVNEGVDPSFLPVGTQIDDKWTWQGTTYDAPWNVVHYNKNGMYLQWEWLTPEYMAFDAQEAMYYVGDAGLAAGTYYFSIGYSDGEWTTDRHIQFTLSQACDPGDQFMLNVSSLSTNPTASKTITVYGKGSTTAKQTATTSDGTDGVELGTFGAGGTVNSLDYQTNGNCNGVCWLIYGNHRWSHSAIRQWLNSDAAAGEWWQPQTPWDRPPSNAANRPGFLSGFSEEFKAVLETVPVVTVLDTVSGFTDAYEITYDKIFLPTLWQMYSQSGSSESYDADGESWDYWKQKAENAGIDGMMNDTTAARQLLIKYPINAHATASSYWSRTTSRAYRHVRSVSAYGTVTSNDASSTCRAFPACIIKKSTPTYIDRLSDIDWTTIKKMTGTDLEIGAQIVDSWIRSDNGTSVDVPWDVVHYDDTSMYLRWHYNLPFNTTFDEREALYYVGEEGLPAGTYYITTSSATGLSTWNNKNIQFTLTSACDPGDQFVITASSSSDPTESRSLAVYGFGETTAKQTTTTSSGTDGTLLGTMGDKGATNGNCNGVYWVIYGNHRWSQSNLRTWLNSDSPSGQWFTPMNPWDRPPSYVTYPGFLYGFNSDFKNILTYSENKTLLDAVSGFTNTYEITQDKIFLPGLEQINYTPEIYDVDGEPWQYYQQLAEEAGITGRFTAANDVLKIFNLDATTTASNSWLRSPIRDAEYARDVSYLGSINNANAYTAYRVAPCCKINLIK